MSQNDHTTTIIFPNADQDDQQTALSAEVYPEPKKNPAMIYIASLKGNAGKRTMITSLNMIADILGYGAAVRLVPDGRCADSDDLQPGETDFRDESWLEVKAEFDAEKAAGQHQGYTLQNLTWIHVRWESLEYEDIELIRATLGQRLTASGANKALSALRQVLKRAWKIGWLTAEKYYLLRSVENLTSSSAPTAAGRALSNGEIAALIKVCEDDPTNAGVRDAAIIAFMYATGARRASVVNFDLTDYDQESGRVIFRNAKRGKTYTTFITNGAKRALDDWLKLRGDRPGAVFLPISQKDIIEFIDEHDQARRMTPQAIYHILNKRAEAAGVDHFSPHDLRRTVAGDLLDSGADIVTVQKMLGHASVSTTAGYDRRPEKAKLEAGNRLHVPYQGNRRKSLPSL